MAGRQMNYKRQDAEKAWETVNIENKKLVKEYFEYLTATDHSAETKEKYLHNLKIFFKWVAENRDNKFFADMTKRDYMGWIASLQDADLSPSRIKVLRSTVSSLSNFCETMLTEEDERFKTYRNFILKIKLPTGEKVREKTFLSAEQIAELLTRLEEAEDYRGCLYVSISYYSAMRKAEVVQLKKSDFAESNIINGYYKTSPIRGKGAGKVGKTRPFFIPKDNIQKYLDMYLKTREDELDDLFLVTSGSPATPDTCNIWCKKYTRMLGVPVYPHSFRGSIATNLKEEGKDVSRIQTLLGHNDVSTTMIYIRKNDEKDLMGLFD